MHLVYSSGNTDQKEPGFLDRYSRLGEIFQIIWQFLFLFRRRVSGLENQREKTGANWIFFP